MIFQDAEMAIFYSGLKIRDVCMDFEPYSKVHSLVSVHLKA